jgi:hypothetical protein
MEQAWAAFAEMDDDPKFTWKPDEAAERTREAERSLEDEETEERTGEREAAQEGTKATKEETEEEDAGDTGKGPLSDRGPPTEDLSPPGGETRRRQGTRS